MAKQSEKFFFDEIVGTSIVYLEHFKNSDINYHLHFLIYKDPEEKNRWGFLCLDLDHFQFFDIDDSETIKDSETKERLLDIIVEDTIEFLESALIITDQNENQSVFHDIFCRLRSPQSYWNKFNEIKQLSFTQSLEEQLKLEKEELEGTLKGTLKPTGKKGYSFGNYKVEGYLMATTYITDQPPLGVFRV